MPEGITNELLAALLSLATIFEGYAITSTLLTELIDGINESVFVCGAVDCVGAGVGVGVGVAIGGVGAAVGANGRDLLWTHFGFAFEFAFKQVRTAPVGRLTDRLTSGLLQSCPAF